MLPVGNVKDAAAANFEFGNQNQEETGCKKAQKCTNTVELNK